MVVYDVEITENIARTVPSTIVQEYVTENDTRPLGDVRVSLANRYIRPRLIDIDSQTADYLMEELRTEESITVNRPSDNRQVTYYLIVIPESSDQWDLPGVFPLSQRSMTALERVATGEQQLTNEELGEIASFVDDSLLIIPETPQSLDQLFASAPPATSQSSIIFSPPRRVETPQTPQTTPLAPRHSYLYRTPLRNVTNLGRRRFRLPPLPTPPTSPQYDVDIEE